MTRRPPQGGTAARRATRASQADAILNSAELYNPSTGTWTATGSMTTARTFHTATLLPNGQVLVAGGSDQYANGLSSAELYNPSTGVWTATGTMTIARAHHTATLLSSGQVLVAGGSINCCGAAVQSSTELYDPLSGTWTAAASMTTPRFYHTATLLFTGQVLVAGGGIGAICCPYPGISSAELYVGSRQR